MADSKMPDWVEEAIEKCSTLLVILAIFGVLCGVFGFVTGSVAVGFFFLGVGVVILLAGGGLASKTTWGFLLALLVCLAIPGVLAYLVVSAPESGQGFDKLVTLFLGAGCPCLIGALGIVVVLIRYRSELDQD